MGPTDCSLINVACYPFWRVGKFVEAWPASAQFAGVVVMGLLTYALWKATAALGHIASEQNQLSQISQRAYLGVEAGNVRLLTSPTGSAIARIRITNNGKLPARGVSWVIRQRFSTSNRLKKFELRPASGEAYLTPGASMVQGGPFFKDEGMHAKLRDTYLYVWGAVFYHDGFRNRATYFCHRYNCVNFLPKSRRFKDGEDRQHRYGNGTDESPPTV